MSPLEENGWSEHRRLVEFRLGQNEATLAQIQADVSAIRSTLAEHKGSNQSRINLMNLGVPAVVALVVVLLDKVMEVLIK